MVGINQKNNCEGGGGLLVNQQKTKINDNLINFNL